MDTDNFTADETLSNLEKLCEESVSCFNEKISNKIVPLEMASADHISINNDNIFLDKNDKNIDSKDLNIMEENNFISYIEDNIIENIDNKSIDSKSKFILDSLTNNNLVESNINIRKSTDIKNKEIIGTNSEDAILNEMDDIEENNINTRNIFKLDNSVSLNIDNDPLKNSKQPSILGFVEKNDEEISFEKDIITDIQHCDLDDQKTIMSISIDEKIFDNVNKEKRKKEINATQANIKIMEITNNVSDNLSNKGESLGFLNEKDFIISTTEENSMKEIDDSLLIEKMINPLGQNVDVEDKYYTNNITKANKSTEICKNEKQSTDKYIDKDDTDVEEIIDNVSKDIKIENIETGITNSSNARKIKNNTKRQNDANKHLNKSATVRSNKQQECIVCKKVIKCKYNIVRNGDIKHLCNDECFKTFRSKPSLFLLSGTLVNNKELPMCTHCRQIISGRPIISTFADKQKFCKNGCLEEYKKSTKLCTECLKDLKKDINSFSAPIDGEGFHDFCSQNCLIKYEIRKKNNENINVKIAEKCSKCCKTGLMKHRVNLHSMIHFLCSDTCFHNFKVLNDLSINSGKCDNCFIKWPLDSCQTITIRFEGEMKKFCGQNCFAAFKTKMQRNIQCTWCSLRKSNFDMVDLQDENKKTIFFCTLNCLSLYRVHLQANSDDNIGCDQCSKIAPAQYHLTMSDASVRNFCGYNCVMSFQNKFVSLTGKQVPTPSQQVTQNTANQAQTTFKSPYGTRLSSKAKHVKNISNSLEDNPSSSKSLSQFIVQPPIPKQVRNKALLCKPYMQTKATSCRPHVISRPSQTDLNWEPQKLALPCPVPFMIPAPMAMYSATTPYPILIPIPIPIPCFIPTTRKSAGGIMKKIKEMQDRMPSDPFEAELLMMAEAVASAGRESESEYEASEEDEAGLVESGSVDAAEDMLQMALRMADMPSEEPILDLEDSVAPAPVRAKEIPTVAQEYAVIGPVMDILQITPMKKHVTKRRNNSTTSRSNQHQRGGFTKRLRLDTDQTSNSMMQSQTIQHPPVSEPPADTNFVLKFTYGVNAYKHWVVQKNAQIEAQILTNQQRGASVRGLKPFKLDVLQSTADELNYALCLFVREVRKPNGEEYAPDSILYLCLGIQEYLYENGRIDNIFTDFFYERFTEYLNEVLSRYEVRLNAQGMLVCRIEEEHLWEAKQLGAHSPYVLLNTLVYFNTKHFMLRTPHEHLALSFSHIMKHWKKTNCPSGKPGRSVYLRYYSPGQGMDPKKKKVPTATLH